EKPAGGAVRIPLHHHGAIANVRQQRIGHVGVILQQIAFGEAELWPEDLPEIREADLPALDGQDHIVLIAGNCQASWHGRKAERREGRKAEGSKVEASKLMPTLPFVACRAFLPGCPCHVKAEAVLPAASREGSRRGS